MKVVQTSSIHQQGSTLIEIMVSMFILALGLMALIAMQTRTSISIKEAELQTVIAQATENLAENMMTNPELSLNGTKTTRNYSRYNKPGSCSATTPTAPSGTVNGADLVEYHQDLFFNQVCSKVTDSTGATLLSVDTIGLNVTRTTLTVTWTTGGSSGKPFEYKYELDNMD